LQWYIPVATAVGRHGGPRTRPGTGFLCLENHVHQPSAAPAYPPQRSPDRGNHSFTDVFVYPDLHRHNLKLIADFLIDGMFAVPANAGQFQRPGVHSAWVLNVVIRIAGRCKSELLLEWRF
jgi:hypothetical protein